MDGWGGGDGERKKYMDIHYISMDGWVVICTVYVKSSMQPSIIWKNE